MVSSIVEHMQQMYMPIDTRGPAEQLLCVCEYLQPTNNGLRPDDAPRTLLDFGLKLLVHGHRCP